MYHRPTAPAPERAALRADRAPPPSFAEPRWSSAQLRGYRARQSAELRPQVARRRVGGLPPGRGGRGAAPAALGTRVSAVLRARARADDHLDRAAVRQEAAAAGAGWRGSGRDGPRRGWRRSRCQIPTAAPPARGGLYSRQATAHRGDGRCCSRPEVYAAGGPPRPMLPVERRISRPGRVTGAASVEEARARALESVSARGTSCALWGRGRGFARHAAGHALRSWVRYQ